MSIEYDNIVKEVIEERLSESDKKKAHAAGRSGNADVNMTMLTSLDKMNKTTVNHSYREIPAIGITGKIKRFIKRLMRKLIFWFVEPCMVQQTEYNSANTTFSAEVNSEINFHNTAIININKQIEILNNNLKQQEQQFNQKIFSLQQKNDEIKASYNNLLNNTISMLQGKVDVIEKYFYLSAATGTAIINKDDFRISFSQTGEDAIIRHIFSVLGIDPAKCKYLDLGANHAVYLSNTYGFYANGARGVLLEANPTLTKELSEQRPRDIVINKCLSESPNNQIKFYILNGDGLSTMNYEAAQGFIKENPKLKIEQTITIDSITITEIIDKYFPEKAPEILNIDLEGMELTTLKMIDFKKFRPLLIICEMIEYKNGLTIGQKNQQILDFMSSVDYEEFAFTGINSIFIDKNVQDGEKI